MINELFVHISGGARQVRVEQLRMSTISLIKYDEKGCTITSDSGIMSIKDAASIAQFKQAYNDFLANAGCIVTQTEGYMNYDRNQTACGDSTDS